jgi:hypothetical protein
MAERPEEIEREERDPEAEVPMDEYLKHIFVETLMAVEVAIGFLLTGGEPDTVLGGSFLYGQRMSDMTGAEIATAVKWRKHYNEVGRRIKRLTEFIVGSQ